MFDECTNKIPNDVIDEYNEYCHYSRTHNTWGVVINYIPMSETIEFLEDKLCVD